MKEKLVISEWASTGTHFYRSIADFENLFNNSKSLEDEFHLSTIVQQNCKNEIFKVNEDRYTKQFMDLGTPDKYINYLKKFSHD
jgi:hypothetical protein